MDERDMQAEYDAFERFDKRTMTMVFTFATDDGDDEEVTFPCKLEVCSLCHGTGRHVNPSIDAHGISGEEFYDDPEFAEEYMAGTYDVACYRCHGDNVWPVIDEQRASQESLARLDEYLNDRYDYIQECEAERRMGC